MIDNDKEKRIRLYLDTMAMNDQLMQWYRTLFLALETIIFAGVLTIHANELLPSWWVFMLAVIGIMLSFAGMWACVQRARVVDRQKKKIQDELYDKDGKPKDPNDDLADWFQIYNPIKGTAEKTLPRTVFNYASHVLVGGLLIFVLWQWQPIGNWHVYLGLTIGYVVLLVVAEDYLSWHGIPEDYKETRETFIGRIVKRVTEK